MVPCYRARGRFAAAGAQLGVGAESSFPSKVESSGDPGSQLLVSQWLWHVLFQIWSSKLLTCILEIHFQKTYAFAKASF